MDMDAVPAGWRRIVAEGGARVMRAAAASEEPVVVDFAFDVSPGRLTLTWSCRPAPADVQRGLCRASAWVHEQATVTCEVCGRTGSRRRDGRTAHVVCTVHDDNPESLSHTPR